MMTAKERDSYDALVNALTTVDRYLRHWAGSRYEVLHETQVIRAALAKAKEIAQSADK